MPRSKIHCQSCLKEIAGTQKGDAKVVDAWTLERGYGRIFLHQECYDRDSAEVKKENKENAIQERTVSTILENVQRIYSL